MSRIAFMIELKMLALFFLILELEVQAQVYEFPSTELGACPLLTYMDSIEMASNGDFYIAGQCSETYQLWIERLNHNKPLWSQAKYRRVYETFVGLAVDSDGGCVTAGYEYILYGSSSERTIFANKYDADGNLLWELDLGLNGYYFRSNRAKALSSGGYALMGLSNCCAAILAISDSPSLLWRSEFNHDSFVGVEEKDDGSLIAVTGKRFWYELELKLGSIGSIAAILAAT